MTVTLFVPMPEWQALSFLRDREEAFDRLLVPCGSHIESEVVLDESEKLFAFRKRADAVATGYTTHPQGFTILRFVFTKLLHTAMTFHGKLVAAGRHPSTDAELVAFTRAGLQQVREKARDGDVELLMDQIFPPCTPERDGPVPATDGFDQFGWGGPTGYGGC